MLWMVEIPLMTTGLTSQWFDNFEKQMRVRSEIATLRQESGLPHADCVECGKAIGWCENQEWVHIDGIPCPDALNDGTDNATEEDKRLAYESHLSALRLDGRADPRDSE
jgi:hypothetical protein